MHLYLTGGTGFIGSHFINHAIKAGHEITALKRQGTQPRVPTPNHQVEWITSDLASWTPGNSSKAPQNSVLIHFAAFGVSPQPCTWDQAFQFNVLDSLALFQRAIQAGIRKIIVCGSCLEYGKSAERYEMIPPDAPLEPIGAYAASKAAQSIAAASLCRESTIELAILRLFTVYGEGQHESNFWPSLKKAALAGENFPMTHGEQIRDFISVDEVADTFLKVASSTLSKGNPLQINVGSGKPETLKNFAMRWWKHWNASGRLQLGAIPYRKGEIMKYVPNTDVNLIKQ